MRFSYDISCDISYDVSMTNKEMIKNGQGIIAIPVDKIGQYFSKLINFYETDSYENIKKWIYTNAIDGV